MNNNTTVIKITLKVNFTTTTKCQSILAQCFKSNRKRCVFSVDLNVVSVPASLKMTGRLFHNDGPATEKARRPYRSRLYRGIVKEW